MTVNYAANFSMGLKPQRDAKLMNSSEKLAWEQELWDEFSADAYANNIENNRKDHVAIVGLVGMLRAGKLGKNNTLWTHDDFETMTTAEQDAYITELKKSSTDWFV